MTEECRFSLCRRVRKAKFWRSSNNFTSSSKIPLLRSNANHCSNIFSTRLIAEFSEQHISFDSFNRKPVSVKKACDYLIEHYAENVFLEQLALLAGLSPFHFSRVFSEQIGMPPHAFQTQVRVARARTLLLEGWSISEVAARTGFADQSHLTRHFKRLVGITPGRYQQNSKNVQDTRNSIALISLS